jgi:hypothetical protein
LGVIAAVFWILIGSGFNGVTGFCSGSKQAKIKRPPKKKGKN